MTDIFERTRILLGDDAVQRLQSAHVAVFGVGGVGGHCIEALARSGVGALTIIDSDTVSETNINRQIIALHSTVGRPKVDVMRERILDINPDCRVTALQMFFLPDTADKVDFTAFDYVADCVDTVTAKIAVITAAKAAAVPVISAMGAGNKLDPTQFEIADISQTSVCPLARVMRSELKHRGIRDVKVVYSREQARQSAPATDASPYRRSTPGSLAFVPSVAGLIMAGEIVRDITGE